MTKTMKVGAALATTAMVLSQFAAVPAYACEWDWCGGGNETDNSVHIKVENSGTITNETKAKADTGDNWAGGSYGGDAGEGGDGGDGGKAKVEGGADWCECEDDPSVANGGDGGNGGDSNGGNAGPGGLVDTGDADANAGTVNTLNTTDVEVEGCGCEEEQDECGCIPPWFRRDIDNHVKVKVKNSGLIANSTKAKADTGDNDADGSFGGDSDDGGDGGDGGKAKVASDDDSWDCGCWDLPAGDGEANGGDGGDGGDSNGGDGDVGGTIRTGDARSDAGTVNVMNTTLIRVTR